MASRPSSNYQPEPGRYHEDHPSDAELVRRVRAKAQERRERRAAKRAADLSNQPPQDWKREGVKGGGPMQAALVSGRGREYERQPNGSVRVLNKPISRRKKRILGLI